MKIQILIFTGLVSLLTLTTGCNGFEKFPLAPVEGEVRCEGKPVPFAMVYFVPVQEGDSVLTGKSGQGVTDREGKFRISTYEPGDGAVTGSHTVRVAPSSSTDPDCPADLSHTKIVQTVQVVKGMNHVVVDVPQRSRRSRLVLPEE